MKTSMRRGLVFGFMVGVLAAVPTTQANATTYYWDANGTTAGAGATPAGTWGASADWSTSSAGTVTTSLSVTTSADSLFFVANPSSTSGTNAFTVTVSGTQNVSSLTFQSSGAPTLSGTGTINLWGGGIGVSQYAYGTTPQGAVTISAPIALQAAQTWANSAVNTLLIAGNVANGEYTLTIGGSGNTTISGIISGGSGGLIKSGTGTLTLAAANTFGGQTNISGGTLDLANGYALQASTLVAPTTGSIVFVNSGNYTFGGLSGSGNVSLQTSGGTAVALTVGGNNGSTTYSGAVERSWFALHDWYGHIDPYRLERLQWGRDA